MAGYVFHDPNLRRLAMAHRRRRAKKAAAKSSPERSSRRTTIAEWERRKPTLGIPPNLDGLRTAPKRKPRRKKAKRKIQAERRDERKPRREKTKRKTAAAKAPKVRKTKAKRSKAKRKTIAERIRAFVAPPRKKPERKAKPEKSGKGYRVYVERASSGGEDFYFKTLDEAVRFYLKMERAYESDPDIYKVRPSDSVYRASKSVKE